MGTLIWYGCLGIGVEVSNDGRIRTPAHVKDLDSVQSCVPLPDVLDGCDRCDVLLGRVD